ncbi:hypothetical protein VPH35_063836 [Triticum aestivum]
MDGPDKLKCARGGGIGGGGVGHSVDRLSALPDDLLHAVLSRLKARQVVRTCVLSTRWRHLWRSVPCLRIDQLELHAGVAGKRALIERHSFKNFAHILLHRHNVALLEEFRLRVDCGSWDADSGWVRRGISQDETWPCRLKRLHLTKVYLDSYSFRLILEAPALASLRLAGHFCSNYSDVMSLTTVTSMPSLVDASICLRTVREFNYNNERNGLIETQSSFLDELFNVTSLHLSCFGVMAHSYSQDMATVECKNLRLTEIIYWADDVHLLVKFLLGLPLFFVEVQASIGTFTSI